MIKKLLKSTVAIGLSITMMVPVQAFAINDPNQELVYSNEGNLGENGENGTLMFNNGSIEINNGIIHTNDGDVTTNNGTISDNNDDVGTNSGYIMINDGSVGTNNGIDDEHTTTPIESGITNNTGSVTTNNGTICSNSGTVTTNNYDVRNNSGTVTTNNGTIEYNTTRDNASTADIHEFGVETNNGTIAHNTGDVNVNSSTGIITTNTGHVEANAGTVTTNLLGEVIFSSTTGTVGKNYATVIVPENVTGTVTNMLYNNLNEDSVADSGSLVIVNNYSNISDELVSRDNIQVQNQYHLVQIMETANMAQVTYAGFTSVDGLNDVRFVKTHANEAPVEIRGTITITPLNGCQLSHTNTRGENEYLGWTLTQNENGSYTISFDYLNRNVYLRPTDLNLILSAIASSAGISSDAEVMLVDNGYIIPATNNNASDSEGDTSDPLMEDFIFIAPSFVIMNAIDNNPFIETYNIDLGKDPDFTSSLLQLMCGDRVFVNRTFNITFTHNGKKYILHIPKVDQDSEEYKACLTLLESEPGGSAGPIRLAQLFASVGFTLTEISDTSMPEQPALPQTPSETNGNPAPTEGSPEPLKTQEQTHNTVMGAEVGMAALSAGNDFVGAATEGLSLASNTGADGVSTYARMGGGSIRQETG